MAVINTGKSMRRLTKLIKERLLAPNDAAKKIVDQRIWDAFGEDWCIVFTDLSGFSRQVAEFGIVHFLQIIHESRRIFDPCIENHDGFLLKSEGDSMLLLFRRPEKAVAACIDMQRAAKAYNEDRSDAEKILLCIGVGLGQMLRVGDDDVFGSEVNAASKLGEDTAKAWEILVTGPVKRALGDKYKYAEVQAPAGTDSAYKLSYDLAKV